MRHQVFKYVFYISFSGVVLSSCKVAQPYVAPEVQTDSLYRDSSLTDSNTIAGLPYQQIFSDPVLQEYISQGLSANLDLQAAYTRVQQAEAYFNQSKANFLPDLQLTAGAQTSRVPEIQRFGRGATADQFNIGASSSWEADIWGRLASSKRAEFANLLQTQAAAQAIQTRVIASIANFYYRLLAMDQQLAITEKTVENWISTVETMRALKTAATVTEAAVVQSEAQRYAAEVTIPDLKQAIRETENALRILLGESPGPIVRGSLQDQRIPSDLSVGVPAQLLANRPDVRQAELNFRQFFELTNVARTAFYPSLSITGSAGWNAQSVGNLLDPATFLASIGAGLTQPVFNRRANRTRLEVALAQQQEALINFRGSLLTAGEEVSNALSLYQTAGQKAVVRRKQTEALERAVDYSQELLENGFANYTEVITARQSLLQAELATVDDRLQQLTAVVELYRALGGGWR
jgi:multidrug efflux system outer membrane protein